MNTARLLLDGRNQVIGHALCLASPVFRKRELDQSKKHVGLLLFELPAVTVFRLALRTLVALSAGIMGRIPHLLEPQTYTGGIMAGHGQ